MLLVGTSVLVPALSASGAEIRCARYPGTAGGTVRVGPVEVDVPPTQEYLVGICWDGDSEKTPAWATPPDVNQYPGCGTPCFSVSGHLHVTGYQLTLTVYTDGQAEYYGPFGWDAQDVPVCITFGDPEPSC
jgi:hypothetical protein